MLYTIMVACQHFLRKLQVQWNPFQGSHLGELGESQTRGVCNESDYSGSVYRLSTREAVHTRTVPAAVTCSSKSEMEEEMHATKDDFKYVRVRGPARRSNTCTMLIVGGVAVVCLVVLVLVVAVAVGVVLGIRGSYTCI